MVDKYFLGDFTREEYILNIKQSVSNKLETESSLIKMHKRFFRENKDVLLIDFGKSIPVYSSFISSKLTIEHYEVIKFTESKLNEIAAAHKEYNDHEIRTMLKDLATRIRNVSKGGMITTEGYITMIEKAIDLKDVTEVVANSSIRFLTNPYYTWKKDFFERKLIKQTLINKATGANKKHINYKLIEQSIVDYDLNSQCLTKPILVNITGLSLSTIKSYLKKYSFLNEIFIAIKGNSGTTKQLKNRGYNSTKLVKRLSA